MRTSTACVLVKQLGYRYTFDGVTSVSHSLNLKVATDGDSQAGTDWVNNARNEPDVVTLSVAASDTHVPMAGWSRQTFASLAQVKEYRLLCQVYTGLRTYDNMLLTALSVQQDETCPDGWVGTLTFTRAGEGTAADPAAENSYTAAPASAGAVSPRKVGDQSGSVLQTILREAGIRT